MQAGSKTTRSVTAPRAERSFGRLKDVMGTLVDVRNAALMQFAAYRVAEFIYAGYDDDGVAKLNAEAFEQKLVGDHGRSIGVLPDSSSPNFPYLLKMHRILGITDYDIDNIAKYLTAELHSAGAIQIEAVGLGGTKLSLLRRIEQTTQ